MSACPMYETAEVLDDGFVSPGSPKGLAFLRCDLPVLCVRWPAVLGKALYGATVAEAWQC